MHIDRNDMRVGEEKIKVRSVDGLVHVSDSTAAPPPPLSTPTQRARSPLRSRSQSPHFSSGALQMRYFPIPNETGSKNPSSADHGHFTPFRGWGMYGRERQ